MTSSNREFPVRKLRVRENHRKDSNLQYRHWAFQQCRALPTELRWRYPVVLLALLLISPNCRHDRWGFYILREDIGYTVPLF